MPFEDTAHPEAKFREKVKIKAYPVQAKAGLLWAYMGPQPVPELWDWDIYHETGYKTIVFSHIPCNWLQDWENIMDPFHVPILHTAFSGVQFVPEMGIMPEVTFEQTALGMRYTAYRKLEDGREMDRVTLALFPHVRIVPDIRLTAGPARGIGWVLPVPR